MPDTPESIECSAQPFDLSFHPQRAHLVATALVDGTLEVHDFSPNEDDENDTIVSSIPVHTQVLSKESKKTASCRAVRFSNDGARIYTGGSAGDVCALDAERACTFSASEQQALLWKLPATATSHGIHVLKELPPEVGRLLVTGDEQGCVTLWDADRSPRHRPALQWKENEDYISGLAYHDHTLLASSADCTLSVFDLRKATSSANKTGSYRRSDDQEDELLSIQVMKNGKKVVCGTQEGVLNVWSWGTWGDISDRFPGHPASIDTLLKVDQDTLLTGSSDGLVRLVQIHPDKLLGVLGDHDGYPIERLEFNSTRSVVGSVSHDPIIRLWDARALQDDDDVDSETEEDVTENSPERSSLAVASKPAANRHDSDDEWHDEDDNDSDGDSHDSSSDEDDEKETTNDRRAKRMKTENEKFFEDL